MDGIIALMPGERKGLLKVYGQARAARRCLVLLLLADGLSYRAVDGRPWRSRAWS